MARSETVPDERASGERRAEATDGYGASASASAGAGGPLAEGHTTARKPPSKWTVLVIVAIGVLMATIDSSIVNISLPPIAAYFGVPLSGTVEWVIIAYLVVIAALLLSVGRLADLVGRKWIWAAGLAVFTAGSALCGAAPTLELLVAERAFQGIGAALLMAISPAMLTAAFPASERGRALGYNAVVVAVGVSIGPTLGGFLTEHYTWRSIFYVNVPLGIIGLLATLLVLRNDGARGRTRFDPLGAILLAVGLSALTLGLSFGEEWGWSSERVVGAGVLALLALVALVVLELRIEAPVVDLRMLRERVFLSANLALVLSFLALFAVSFLLPFYLEQLRGFSTQDAGLLLTPLPLTIAVIAPFSGALADRFGTRWLAASGLAIACIGLVLISQLNASSSIPDIIWRLCVTGVGQGLFQSPNNSALMGAAPRARQGTASGFLATGRVMGQSVSVALAGAIFAGLGAARAGAILSSGHPLPPALVTSLQSTFTTGFHSAFIVCAAIAAVGVFASLVRGKEHKEHSPH